MHVTKALEGVTGVFHVDVPDWSSGEASLSAEPDVTEDELIHAVERAGYRASVRRPVETRSDVESAREAPVVDGQDAEYDLVVIGTGAAGMAAAIRATELGRRAAIIEAGVLGGTCVNTGCVPSKTLIRAADLYHRAGHHPFAGLQTRTAGVDWQMLIEQKDQLIADMRRDKYADVLASYGDAIALIRGRARLGTDGQVVVDDGRAITANRVVVATGARSRILRLDGIENVDVLTSTSAMALAEQPRSLIVIGGGAVGLELGQLFARLGTEVTVLEYMPQIVPGQEPEIAAALADYLDQEGLAIHTGVRPRAIRREADKKVLVADIDGHAHEFRAEQVLVAVGRAPRTAELGLVGAGVELDDGGFIQVNAQLQTS
ncbi:MAG: FAD-dependent oxidoreductase, partial [Anaerolineae bacterium]